ncbi:MAG: hypothetical protein ACJATT_004983 [Myxococcota bacterium]|jgi:hypothetical protein
MFRSDLAAALVFVLPGVSIAAPGELPHSGCLLAASGDAINDAVTMEFSPYPCAACRVAPPWSETETVQLSGGCHTTVLGDQNTLSERDGSGTSWWLDIAVDGVTLGPRTPMGSVPMAMSVSGPLRAMSVNSSERDALTARPGQVIFNSSLGALQVFEGTA